MVRWFATSNVTGRGTAARAEPFRIPCACGRVAEGPRRPEWQQLACDDCGRPLFVLPANVYPVPQVRPRRRPAAPAGDSSTAREGSAVRPSTTAGAESASPAVRPPARRFLTPLRIIVPAILVVVAATGLHVWHAHRLEAAEATLKQAVERGDEHLQVGNFAAAAAEFRRACAALDITGRDDRTARRIRQRSREATAASRLAAAGPFELLREAERSREAGHSEAWQQEQFPSLYAGRWVVMETFLDVREDAGGRSRFTIDSPVVMTADARSGTSISMHVDAELDVFRRFAFESRPVIFAAQLESCRFDADRHRWVLRLRRDTGHLWCGLDTYRELGFEDREFADGRSVRGVLQEQARLMEVEP